MRTSKLMSSDLIQCWNPHDICLTISTDRKFTTSHSSPVKFPTVILIRRFFMLLNWNLSLSLKFSHMDHENWKFYVIIPPYYRVTIFNVMTSLSSLKIKVYISNITYIYCYSWRLGISFLSQALLNYILCDYYIFYFPHWTSFQQA